MEPLHRILKAIAEPNRLRILNLLLEAPLCVCEMESLLDLPQPLLSRHLAYLRSAGLAMDRRIGTRVQYAIPEGNPVIDRLRECLRGLLQSEEVYRRDRERLHEWRGGCCGAGERVSAGVNSSQGAWS
ncbi:MAG: metalloregulator ArsR/SmtB family transcription factor [Bryobacteraceae bacterium]